MEFEGGAGGGGFGLGLAADPVFGFEPIGGMGLGVSASTGGPPLPCSVPSGGVFPLTSGDNGSSNNGNRIPPVPTSPGILSSLKIPSFGNNPNPNLMFSPLPANSLPLPLSLPQGMFFQDPPMEEKPQFFGPNLLLNQQQVHTPQNQSFFLPLSPYAQPDHHQQHFLIPPQPKRHQPMVDPSCQISSKVPFSGSGQDLSQLRHQQPQQQQPHLQCLGNLHALPYHGFQQRLMKPKAVAGDEAAAATTGAAWQQPQQQQQALVEQLFEAAKQVEAGNSVIAQGILARLNHQLSPIGKPLLRSAFYFKEVIRYITANSLNTPPSPPPPLQNPSALVTPLDVVLKLNAYKAFSEISPILQFTNFTCTQALLEDLNGCNHIHIIDFDIGVGGQWSSFMRELAQLRCGATAATPSLKITAFASLSSSHPLELSLTRENLTDFANELNIPFEFNALSLDPFNAASVLNVSSGSDEAIAVNLPVGSAYPAVPALLHLVKQLHPKIVISVDHGCDRSDLSFSDHFLHALKSSTVLLDSMDAAGISPEVMNKIERFLLQPRIESAVLGRYRAADQMLPWRTIFASAGFIPLPFSNPTENQAECLLKRIQVRGFDVEKRQSSLLLCWQHRELVSVSAWRC